MGYRRDLDAEVRLDVTDAGAGRNPQRVLPAGERRRPARLGRCAARSARRGPSTTRSTTLATGTIYAAAASEWHGSTVWRSPDLGETWTQSSEGLAYEADGERKLSKVSTLAVKDGRVLVGVEAPGIFESRDGARRWSVLSTLAGEPGSELWDDPANQPPGHLGISALMFDDRRPVALLGDRAGDGAVRDDGRRHVVDAAEPRPARRLAAPARGGRLLRPQARPLAGRRRPHVPAEPRRHAPQRRRRPELDGDHGGAADRVRLRRGHASARPRHVLRRPARPRPRALHARRARGGLADARRRGELAAARPRPAAARTPTSACCARRWRSTATTRPGLYFGTSTGQVFASTDEGESWSEIASYLPAISSVEVAVLD